MSTADDARRNLRSWRKNREARDPLVRAALTAGLSKEEVHILTGLGRTTIDRITSKERIMSAATFRPDDQVVYGGDLPCGLYPGEHLGIVEAVEPDASGDQIVTVAFSCVGGVCSTQDIPASELKWAGRR
jgi:hypothetical protein